MAEVAALAAIETPVGWLAWWHDGDGALMRVQFLDEAPVGAATEPVGGALAQRFRAWFAGDLAALEAVPVRPAGSRFQLAVWAELQAIPAGQTASYAQIARRLGGAASGAGPNARAVGTANAKNPVAIAIPCHRVIGADGSLTGYAGGLWRKDWLLRHEGWAPVQAAML